MFSFLLLHTVEHACHAVRGHVQRHLLHALEGDPEGPPRAGKSQLTVYIDSSRQAQLTPFLSSFSFPQRDVIQAQKKAKSKHEKAQKEIEHIRKRMEKYNDPKVSVK